MSTKHVRSVADLVRFGCGLEVACGVCGKRETFAAWDVAQVFVGASLSAVRRRLKCSRCGAKAARMTVLSPPAPR